MYYPESTRHRMRKMNLGDRNPFFGQHHTDETKARLSKSLMGHEVTAEVRAFLSVTKKGNTARIKARGRYNRDYGSR